VTVAVTVAVAQSSPSTVPTLASTVGYGFNVEYDSFSPIPFLLLLLSFLMRMRGGCLLFCCGEDEDDMKQDEARRPCDGCGWYIPAAVWRCCSTDLIPAEHDTTVRVLEVGCGCSYRCCHCCFEVTSDVTHPIIPPEVFSENNNHDEEGYTTVLLLLLPLRNDLATATITAVVVVVIVVTHPCIRLYHHQTTPSL